MSVNSGKNAEEEVVSLGNTISKKRGRKPGKKAENSIIVSTQKEKTVKKRTIKNIRIKSTAVSEEKTKPLATSMPKAKRTLHLNLSNFTNDSAEITDITKEKSSNNIGIICDAVEPEIEANNFNDVDNLVNSYDLVVDEDILEDDVLDDDLPDDTTNNVENVVTNGDIIENDEIDAGSTEEVVTENDEINVGSTEEVVTENNEINAGSTEEIVTENGETNADSTEEVITEDDEINVGSTEEVVTENDEINVNSTEEVVNKNDEIDANSIEKAVVKNDETSKNSDIESVSKILRNVSNSHGADTSINQNSPFFYAPSVFDKFDIDITYTDNSEEDNGVIVNDVPNNYGQGFDSDDNFEITRIEFNVGNYVGDDEETEENDSNEEIVSNNNNNDNNGNDDSNLQNYNENSLNTEDEEFDIIGGVVENSEESNTADNNENIEENDEFDFVSYDQFDIYASQENNVEDLNYADGLVDNENLGEKNSLTDSTNTHYTLEELDEIYDLNYLDDIDISTTINNEKTNEESNTEELNTDNTEDFNAETNAQENLVELENSDDLDTLDDLNLDDLFGSDDLADLTELGILDDTENLDNQNNLENLINDVQPENQNELNDLDDLEDLINLEDLADFIGNGNLDVSFELNNEEGNNFKNQTEISNEAVPNEEEINNSETLENGETSNSNINEVKDETEVETEIKDETEVEAEIKDEPEVETEIKDENEVKAESEDKPENEVKDEKETESENNDEVSNNEVDNNDEDSKEIDSSIPEGSVQLESDEHSEKISNITYKLLNKILEVESEIKKEVADNSNGSSVFKEFSFDDTSSALSSAIQSKEFQNELEKIILGQSNLRAKPTAFAESNIDSNADSNTVANLESAQTVQENIAPAETILNENPGSDNLDYDVDYSQILTPSADVQDSDSNEELKEDEYDDNNFSIEKYFGISKITSDYDDNSNDDNVNDDEVIEENDLEDALDGTTLDDILLEKIYEEDLNELDLLGDSSNNPDDPASDLLAITESLSKAISDLENTPDMSFDPLEEDNKSFNILINKDDIFSVSILNETYDIIADFDGISIISESIHISTPKNNFFVKAGEYKYIEIHNNGDHFEVFTNFENIDFANAINNVEFSKKDNRLELTIKEAFKLSSVKNKIQLSMLNTVIADMTSTVPSPDNIDENSICDNRTLLISEETQKVYLPYTLEEIMQKLGNNSEYKTAKEVIDKEYTLPLSTFRFPILSRFKEAYRFMRIKEKSSVYAAIDLALELMFNSNLNPAIIRACKDLKELNIYLDCLYENELEKFDCFKIVYKVLPKAK